jgi:hypothetical protein
MQEMFLAMCEGTLVFPGDPRRGSPLDKADRPRGRERRVKKRLERSIQATCPASASCPVPPLKPARDTRLAW